MSRKLFFFGNNPAENGLVRFFIWLLNLVDLFDIIPDPAEPPPPTPAPSPPTPAPNPIVQPPIPLTAPTTPAPASPPSFAPPLPETGPATLAPTAAPFASLNTTLIACTVCNNVRDCLEGAKLSSDQSEKECAHCLSGENVQNVFKYVALLPPCEDMEAQTCGNLANEYNICDCSICQEEVDACYECVINEYEGCSVDLCCFTDSYCSCQYFNNDGSCADCFSSFNTVDVKDKGTVFIDQIQIGDLVRISDGKDEAYSRVYSLGHLDHESQAQYLQIFMEELQQPLEISPKHLLYVNGRLSPALQVQKGDVLRNKGTPKVVSKIKSVQRRGKYAPLTESGTIQVSGVDASNYVSMSNILPSTIIKLFNFVPYQFHHAIGHGWTAPLRWLCAMDFSICKGETYTNGYASWFHETLRFTTKLGETPKLVQLGFALLVAPILLALNSPLSMVALVVSIIIWYKNAATTKTKGKCCA